VPQAGWIGFCDHAQPCHLDVLPAQLPVRGRQRRLGRRDRYRPQTLPSSIYINQQFNAVGRTCLRRLAGQNSPHLAWLDAMLNPAQLIQEAETRLRQMVALRDTQEAI
jgi:hypothetical protein